MPILKKTPKSKKEVEEKVPMFHEGDKVMVDIDGADTECEITELDNDKETAEVKDENGDKYDCTFEELKLINKKAKKKEPEVEEETKTPKKKGGANSFAGIFNKTKAASGGGGIKDGRYEAIVVELGINETEKGMSGFIKYTIVNDEKNDQDGKTGVEFFQLLNAEGEEQKGLEFFKGSLVQLGMDEDAEISKRADLEEILEDIQDKKLWVEINVRKKDGYTHHYLNQVMDDQDSKPDL